jgi:hypothetical protein
MFGRRCRSWKSQNLSDGEEGMSVEKLLLGDMRQGGGWCMI